MNEKAKKKSAEFCIRLGWVGALLRYSLLHTHTHDLHTNQLENIHTNQNRIQIMFFDTWTHEKKKTIINGIEWEKKLSKIAYEH